MAANDPRTEVRFSRETLRRLRAYRQELSKSLGKPVSMSKLVQVIVDQFFEKVDLTEEEKR